MFETIKKKKKQAISSILVQIAIIYYYLYISKHQIINLVVKFLQLFQRKNS